MEGFDPMQWPNLVSPMSLDGVNTGDYLGSLQAGLQRQLYDTGDFGDFGSG